MLENTVLRGIFGPKREEVSGDRRKLQSEELNNLYSSLNIIREFKSRMRWAGHVARMGEMKNSYRIFVENPEGDYSEDLGIDGCIIIKYILLKWGL
jgi:hypothetical protein